MATKPPSLMSPLILTKGLFPCTASFADDRSDELQQQNRAPQITKRMRRRCQPMSDITTSDCLYLKCKQYKLWEREN